MFIFLWLHNKALIWDPFLESLNNQWARKPVVVKIQDKNFKRVADNQQLLDEGFLISGIIKVEVSVISRAEGS